MKVPPGIQTICAGTDHCIEDSPATGPAARLQQWGSEVTGELMSGSWSSNEMQLAQRAKDELNGKTDLKNAEYRAEHLQYQ